MKSGITIGWDSERGTQRWHDLSDQERAARTQASERLIWASLGISFDAAGKALRRETWRILRP